MVLAHAGVTVGKTGNMTPSNLIAEYDSIAVVVDSSCISRKNDSCTGRALV